MEGVSKKDLRLLRGNRVSWREREKERMEWERRCCRKGRVSVQVCRSRSGLEIRVRLVRVNGMCEARERGLEWG